MKTIFSQKPQVNLVNFASTDSGNTTRWLFSPPLQKLGIFYCYFNPILQPIFLLFFMLFYIYFFPIVNLLF